MSSQRAAASDARERVKATYAEYQSAKHRYFHRVGRVLHHLRQATEIDPGYYYAWHTWAKMNFEVVQTILGQDSIQIRFVFGPFLPGRSG